ncbi:MAG: hypothetical protein ACWA40_10440 [Planktomarina sp.]
MKRFALHLLQFVIFALVLFILGVIALDWSNEWVSFGLCVAGATLAYAFDRLDDTLVAWDK